MPTNQWIGEDYYNVFGVKNPKPGFGTASDTQGYFTDKDKYVTYEQLKAEGLGDPRTIGWESSGGEAGAPSSGTQLQGNDAMLAKYPLWDPEESFFAPFAGALKDLGPFLAATSLGGGLAGAGWGGLGGDIWSGLTPSGDAPWGVNPQGGNVADFDNLDLFGSGTGTNSQGWGLNELGEWAPEVTGGNTLTQFGTLPAGLESSPGYQQLLKQLGPTAAKTAIGKLLSGEASADDYAKLLGTLGSTGLGVLGSMNQSSALERIANQSRTDRQPFLDFATQTLKGGPEAYAAGPGAGALKGVLAKLSAGFGNPIGAPAALQIATDSALNGWQNAVTGFGNIGLSGQDSRNQLLSNAATADRGVTTALSSGLGNLTQPEDSLESLLKRLLGMGLNTGATLA